MAIRQIFRFRDEAAGYIQPDPEAVEQTTDSTALLYHRTIVVVTSIFGAIAAVAGEIVMAFSTAESPEEYVKGLLLGPLIFGIIGLILGASVACLFAPQAFMTGPVGQKWMKLIGTNSVITARVVCAAIIIAIVGLPVALVLYSESLKNR